MFRIDADKIFQAHQRAYKRVGLRDLGSISATFGASPSDVGELFAVSRQAVDQWSDRGVPSNRLAEVGRVAAVARRLRSTFKAERIPELVRQANPGLGGSSVLAVLAQTNGADRVMEALDRLTSYVPAPSSTE